MKKKRFAKRFRISIVRAITEVRIRFLKKETMLEGENSSREGRKNAGIW